jgi:hypothetical protein
LQITGSGLCLAIVGPLKWGPLPEGMRLGAACHTEMARQLAALWIVVFSTTQSVLGCSLTEAFQEDVVGEMLIEFQE